MEKIKGLTNKNGGHIYNAIFVIISVDREAEKQGTTFI
jgi:hypothetical protein